MLQSAAMTTRAALPSISSWMVGTALVGTLAGASACGGSAPPPSSAQAPTAKDAATHVTATGRGIGTWSSDGIVDPQDGPSKSPSAAKTQLLTSEPTEAEQKISAHIRESLANDANMSMSARYVKVITIGSTVILRGNVRSAQERTSVEMVALTTPGVAKIVNELEVRR